MSLIKQLPMNSLQKFALLLGCCLMISTISTAQDATAASLYNKGLASLKAKDYENGYPQIEEALKAAEAEGNEKVIGLAKKNGAKAAYNLGSSKRKAGALDEALTLFDRGMELNPEYSGNFMGKAQVLEKKKDYTAAVSAYVEAGGIAEKNAKADRAATLFKRAGTMVGKLYSTENYDDAITAGKALIEVKESPTAHYYVAKALNKKKDDATAATHINKAVELAAAAGKVEDKYYYSQGTILEGAGDKANAAAAYKKITGEKYKANAEYRLKEIGLK